MADDYAELISTFQVLYRFIAIQTYDEANEAVPTHTDADILYDSFGLYADLASDELSNILASRSIPIGYLTDNQINALICHLVADNFEKGNPDWSFRSQSQAPGVSFSRGEDTGPRLAIKAMIDSIEIAYRRSVVSGGRGSAVVINSIKDKLHYPKRWKRSGIPSYDDGEEGFDASETPDMGADYNDQQQNTAW
jgi:hypothetical protein